jgi:hypothetical protein
MVPEFKYLGLVLNRGMNMAETQRPRSGALIGRTRETMKVARSLYVNDCLGVMLQLYQTFALPAGMYGCQVWGTRYMRIDRVFEAEVSRMQLSFLKRQAGAPGGTANWVTATEMAKSRPIHQYWVRALTRFHGRCLTSNSPLLVDVLTSDTQLAAAGCNTCWASEFVGGLKSIATAAGTGELGVAWANDVMGGRQLAHQAVSATLQAAYDRIAWRDYEHIHNIRVSELPTADGKGRMHLTYHTWFKPAAGVAPSWLKQPPGMNKQAKQLLRFRVGAHHLGVNTGRRQRIDWQSRTCSRCSTEQMAHLSCRVDDEHHMIFDCAHFQGLRTVDPSLSAWIQQAADTREFMRGDPNMIMNFIYGCMNELDRLQFAAEQG